MGVKRQEPRRVPKTPITSQSERLGAGCLGLFILPWFLSSLLGAFFSAGMPLNGPSGIVVGAMNLFVLVPLAIVLGSASLSAISRGLGSDEPIQLAHRASAGVGLSAIAIFVLTSLSLFLGAGGAASVMALVGILTLIGTIATFATRTARQSRPQRQRRKHSGPPRAPWSHPLARTEQVNMYAEALADEVSVIGVLAAAVASILMANPIPLLVAGGLELMWVALVPDTAWFRGRVERKQKELANDQARDYREEQREFLASDQIERHQNMVQHLERTKATLAAAGLPFDEQKLERAVDHHLWLMQLENYYSDIDTPTRLREMDEQVAAAAADAEGLTGRVLEVTQKRAEVLRRRQRQARELLDREHEVRDKRQTLEETMLLVTESALAGSARFDEIDDILFDLQATEDVVLDLKDEEDALEREIEVAYAESKNG